MNGNVALNLGNIVDQRKEVVMQDRACSIQWAIAAAARGEDPAITIARAKAFYAWVRLNVEPKLER